MARIYKSFQIKIDKTAPQKVSTGQKIAPEKKHPMVDEDIPDGLFKEIPLDQLTGADGAPVDAKSGEGSPDHSRDENEKAAEEKPTWGGKIARLLAETARKNQELTAWEERLKAWEKALMDREKYIETEETKLHQEIMTKRKNLDEESGKVMEMAKKSADNILKIAAAESETLKKGVHIEVETIRTKAQKEGFALGEEKGVAAGEKSGFEEGKFEWQNLILETETLIKELHSSRIGVLKASEEEIVQLILSFAKRVLKAECQTRPEVIMRNIDAAINKIADTDKIVIRINLRDKAMAEARKNDFLKHLSGVGELRIVEDPSLTPGGIKIETSVGTIDATIESQAEELEHAIVKALQQTE